MPDLITVYFMLAAGTAGAAVIRLWERLDLDDGLAHRFLADMRSAETLLGKGGALALLACVVIAVAVVWPYTWVKWIAADYRRHRDRVERDRRSGAPPR